MINLIKIILILLASFNVACSPDNKLMGWIPGSSIIEAPENSKLEFVVQPTDGKADTNFATSIQVRILDEDNDIIDNFAGPITIGIETDPLTGSETYGSPTVNAIDGVATFNNLQITQKGIGFALNATSGTATKAVSNTFTLVQPIYRSVGEGSSTAIETGAGNAMTISGFTASFATALDSKVGVGDAIQYDTSGDTTPEEIVFIHKRIDNQTYFVKKAEGSKPTAIANKNDWSLFRAYDVTDVDLGVENSGINGAVSDFDSQNNNLDLVTRNEEWNIALYADVEITGRVRANEGNVTDSTHWINYFAPYKPEHVGVSQRHNGVWDPSKALIRITDGGSYAVYACNPYFKFEGFQVYAKSGALRASPFDCMIESGDIVFAN
ncbi:hypothetical protein N9W41_01605, partial [bacterium]|nr:hypothetical protein [bacterium]